MTQLKQQTLFPQKTPDGSSVGQAPLSRVHQVSRSYRIGRRGLWGGKISKKAVSQVTLSVSAGRTAGLVGESGSGKSTLARLMLGQELPSEGTVYYREQPMPKPFSRAWKKARRLMQMVFQDPYAALDRRLTVLEQVAEPLLIHGLADKKTALEMARDRLARVSFPAGRLGAKPTSLSGGQLQRAVIARAVILRPEFLICDEPVSSLDVSVQAQVLSLLEELKSESNLAMLFVSHDLNVVNYLSDDLAVMYKGRLVETGPAGDVVNRPAHPYTELLLNSSPGAQRRPIVLPKLSFQNDDGCPFLGRCPRRQAECSLIAPPLIEIGLGRRAACLFPSA
jgi:peptide/nickel transport system ATP-binding protein